MKKLISLLFILFLAGSSAAQVLQPPPSAPPPPPPPPPPSLSMQPGEDFMKSFVVIFNNNDSRISFLLGDLTNMDTVSLKEKEIWISPAYKVNPIIKIQTLDVTVVYQLTRGNYYMIVWNNEKRCWDISKIVREE